ncbi:MAG TPA: hypothetical protein VFQ19_08965 [Nocardioidaceae bacterium]|nr:hypothetical protein [Nocardioidaceae bacterium]
MTDRIDTAGEEPAAGAPAQAPAAEGVEATAGPDGAGNPAVRDLVAVVGSYLLLGLVCGLLWWLLVDPAVFTKAQGGGGSMGEVELSNRFNGDGWYAVIGAVAGLSSGVALTWWRSRNFVLTTVLLVAGASLAAAVMALTGQALGPGDPDAALAAARVGAQVPVPLEVTAKASYLVWPMAALIGALVVLWSPPRDDAADDRRDATE